jgi:hypothetical protein
MYNFEGVEAEQEEGLSCNLRGGIKEKDERNNSVEGKEFLERGGVEKGFRFT